MIEQSKAAVESVDQHKLWAWYCLFQIVHILYVKTFAFWGVMLLKILWMHALFDKG